MKPATSLDDFVVSPVGKWWFAGTTLLWCHSSELCGTVCWGRPDGPTARVALDAYRAFRALTSFDSIVDGSGLEGFSPDAILALMEWIRAESEELRKRLRRQLSVAPPGLDALTLSGIVPQLGQPFPVEFVATGVEAFRRLLPDGGDELAAEVAEIAAALRDAPALIGQLRALLRQSPGKLTVAAAARALGASTRSLQRQLALAGTSFRAEALDARFESAAHLLSATDQKIGTIAGQLGITNQALSSLIRERTGQRPAEYREAIRKK